MVKYAMCIDGDMNQLIGWNQDADCYSAVWIYNISEDKDGNFIVYADTLIEPEDEDDEDGWEDEIWIYVEDTIENIQYEIDFAQREFDDPINIVELKSEGNTWYPVRIVA